MWGGGTAQNPSSLFWQQRRSLLAHSYVPRHPLSRLQDTRARGEGIFRTLFLSHTLHKGGSGEGGDFGGRGVGKGEDAGVIPPFVPGHPLTLGELLSADSAGWHG